jgi:WD40 repeat protein
MRPPGHPSALVLQVWDPAEGKCQGTMTPEGTGSALCLLEGDGRHRLAVGDEDGRVTVWDLGEAPLRHGGMRSAGKRG